MADRNLATVIRQEAAPPERRSGVDRRSGRDRRVVDLRREIGGRGFAVHRLGQGNLYHVRVNGPDDSSCECMGFLRWGRCKHVAALGTLIRDGQLG